MRILVTGGRRFNRRVALERALDAIDYDFGVDLLMCGGASGADWLAIEWAQKRGILTEVYLADWETHGKSAGPIRNQEMINKGKPDMVVAFPGGAGTKDCVARARRKNIVIAEIVVVTDQD